MPTEPRTAGNGGTAKQLRCGQKWRRSRSDRAYGKRRGQVQAAERGLRRAKVARKKAGLAAFARVLGSLRLSSLDQVDNLKTLQEIVVALEGK